MIDGCYSTALLGLTRAPRGAVFCPTTLKWTSKASLSSYLLERKLTSGHKHLLGPCCVFVRGDLVSRHPHLMQNGHT